MRDSDQRVIIVTLNDYDHYNDHSNFCNWAFENYKQKTLVKANTAVATVENDGKKGDTGCKGCPYLAGGERENAKITSRLRIQSNQGVPMKEGTVGGRLIFYSDGKEICLH